jgi:L-Ala-D/L-Glu epimerase
MIEHLSVDHAELYKLSIPFKIPFTMNFEHAAATRNSCDSYIWVIRSGEFIGVGEAVFRDYVSGSFGADPFSYAAEETRNLLTDRLELTASLDSIHALASDHSVGALQLPVLCGIETALLDLLCAANSTDIYRLLGKSPVRETMMYGGVLPLLEPDTARKILGMYRDLEIPNLRIKVARDEAHTVRTFTIAREILGESFDLRVDANGSWSEELAHSFIPILTEMGVSIVEEPVGRNAVLQSHLARAFPDVTFVADESVLTISDLKQVHELENFGMINVRLVKNGGLLRSLELADRIQKLGLRFQLGCHVGETGVLSALGRAAASLMANPEYVDGSFDRYLLSENITREHVSFDVGGHAKATHDQGLGYVSDMAKIKRWSVDRKTC